MQKKLLSLALVLKRLNFNDEAKCLVKIAGAEPDDYTGTEDFWTSEELVETEDSPEMPEYLKYPVTLEKPIIPARPMSPLQLEEKDVIRALLNPEMNKPELFMKDSLNRALVGYLYLALRSGEVSSKNIAEAVSLIDGYSPASQTLTRKPNEEKLSLAGLHRRILLASSYLGLKINLENLLGTDTEEQEFLYKNRIQTIVAMATGIFDEYAAGEEDFR